MFLPKFHLAFPVTNLEATRSFYLKYLGCSIGRTGENWIDFSFFGHQISAHLVDKMPVVSANPVDCKSVPTNHFGVILEWEAWHRFVAQLRVDKVSFLIDPYIRFEGETGEQATLFITDPSGNALEFKSFKQPDQVFASKTPTSR